MWYGWIWERSGQPLIGLLLTGITVRICTAYPESLTKLSWFFFLFRLIGGSDNKLIYRHYATLYFVFCVDSSESELGILDLIQVRFFFCFVFFSKWTSKYFRASVFSCVFFCHTWRWRWLSYCEHTWNCNQKLFFDSMFISVFWTVFEKVVSQVDEKGRKQTVWNWLKNQQLFFAAAFQGLGLQAKNGAVQTFTREIWIMRTFIDKVLSVPICAHTDT